jgi:hypothetical protein
MNLHRLPVALLIFVLTFPAFLYAAPDPTPLASHYDLRVYGPIKAEDRTSAESYYHQIRLTAQSHAQAEVLLCKFIRDYTNSPMVTTQPVTGGGSTIPVIAFESGRRILPVLHDGQSAVDLYLFDSPMDLNRFVTSSSGLLAEAVAIEVRNYPYYFDFWDRHAMGSWYFPMTTEKGKDFTDDGDYSFMRHYGMNVNIAGSYSSCAAQADRYGIGYKFNRWLDVSISSYDNHPEAADRGDPDVTFLNNYYGDVPYSDNPVGFGQMQEMVGFLKQFCGDEYLTSVTDPHGETGPELDSYFGSNQRDEFSRQDFIHYLRDLRKLSLVDLGRRWYGQADHYKSWDEVHFPREREFYGWQDGQSQDLGGTWKLKIADQATGEASQFAQPGFDDSGWFAFQQPGTSYIDVSHRPEGTGGWNRFSFTPDPALANSGKPVYLTVCPFNDARRNHPSSVYFNGQKLGELTFGYGLEWGQFDVTSLLRPGANVLAVQTILGMVRGPAFLTLKKAEIYPTSEPTLNARLFDLREWVADNVARANARDIGFLRSIDPARPIKIMAYDSMTDIMMPYAQALGAYPHCTGESAFYRPWFKRYGYLRGVNDSSEPSQPAKNLAELRYLFFTMTMEGMNAHDYFIHLHNILGDPEQKAWYEKNLRYFELMGAYNLKKPDIAIARSLRVLRVFPNDVAEENDPGRGDLQQSHNTYVYCSERDIADHLVDSYKVIIDDNFHTLEPEDVDHLQAWVEQGGTLVLNQRSGRNTYLQPNTWPVARLMGCVPTIRPQEGNIKFEADPVILKAYAGQSFANKGESVDWQNYNYFGDSIALEPAGNDVAVVARYDDGKPAIVVRTLGKGRVVILGSAFYRKTSDVKGVYVGSPDEIAFYDHLFADLGVAPVVQSTQDKLWSERFISNSGSTEMLVLGNEDRETPLQGASAVWDLGFKPRRVFDPATGTDVTAKIEGNRVTISDVDLGPNELRYFAVERSDWSAGEAVKHWLSRQSDLWHAITIPAAQPPIDLYWPISLYNEFLVKQFIDEATARQALAPDFSTDKTWLNQRQSDWAAAGLSTGTNIWGVYRKTFRVEPAWLKNLRGVELMKHEDHYVTPGEMAINGVVVARNENTVATPAQILAALKPGDNLLTVLSNGRKGDGNGGFTSIFALRRLPAGEEVDLSADWTGYTSEVDSTKVSFPAQGQWIMLRKQWTLPEASRNVGSVWAEVDGAVAAVSVNGRVLYNSNRYGSVFPSRGTLRVNITAALKREGQNEIGIGMGSWLNATFSATDKLDVKSVKLYLVPK